MMKIITDTGEEFNVVTVGKSENAIRTSIRVVRDTLDDIDTIIKTESLVVVNEDGTETHYEDINYNCYVVGKNHTPGREKDIEIWFYQEQGQRVTHLTKDVGTLKQNSNQTTMALELLVNEIIPSLSK